MGKILKTMDERIQDELDEWKKIGIEDPAAQGVLSPNVFLESVKMRAFIELLMALEIITQEDMERAYKSAMLSSLEEARAGIMELRSNIAIPKMVIPRGKIQ